MAIQIQLRRGTASQWSTSNPILAQGEMGLETDTGRFKVGDGINGWNALAYSSGPTGPQGPTGVKGSQGNYGLNPIFSRQGTLVVQTGEQRFYVERAGTLTSVRATVGTPSSGGSVVVDVLINGVTALSGSIIIPPGQYTTKGIIAQNSVNVGDYFTVNINGVGTVTAGANLTVTLVIE
jgi:hypothetical protein